MLNHFLHVLFTSKCSDDADIFFLHLYGETYFVALIEQFLLFLMNLEMTF